MLVQVSEALVMVGLVLCGGWGEADQHIGSVWQNTAAYHEVKQGQNTSAKEGRAPIACCSHCDPPPVFRPPLHSASKLQFNELTQS